MKYTAEEVRAHAKMLRECRINAETTRDRQQDKLADICDAYADLLGRIEADEGDAFKWQLFCADCDDYVCGNRVAINVVNDACNMGSGALERHYGQAARDGLDAAIAATREGEE